MAPHDILSDSTIMGIMVTLSYLLGILVASLNMNLKHLSSMASHNFEFSTFDRTKHFQKYALQKDNISPLKTGEWKSQPSLSVSTQS